MDNKIPFVWYINFSYFHRIWECTHLEIAQNPQGQGSAPQGCPNFRCQLQVVGSQVTHTLAWVSNNFKVFGTNFPMIFAFFSSLPFFLVWYGFPRAIFGLESDKYQIWYLTEWHSVRMLFVERLPGWPLRSSLSLGCYNHECADPKVIVSFLVLLPHLVY